MANWIEQRFKALVDNETLTEENEMLLKSLRLITDQLLASVEALYGNDIQDIKRQFMSFDVNQDGLVDRKKMKDGLLNLGLTCTDALLNAVFDFLSTNGMDIHYNRFLQMIEWTMGNKGNRRRSLYRGVSAAPLSSGRLWQAKLQLPGPLVFTTTPEAPLFLAYTDNEIQAAKSHDQALIERAGYIDAAPFLNFLDDASMTEATKQSMQRELARRAHMKGTGRTAVLRMLGKMIMSKRTLYGAKLADLHSSFNAIDVDGSGSLNRSELDKAFDRLGLGLTMKQKRDAAELFLAASNGENEGGVPSITWEAYRQVMIDAKRAYAEDMKTHRTLISKGILKRKKRYLKARISNQDFENGWDNHFAGSLLVQETEQDFNQEKVEQDNRKLVLNQNATQKERLKKAKQSYKHKQTNNNNESEKDRLDSNSNIDPNSIVRRKNLTAEQNTWSSVLHSDHSIKEQNAWTPPLSNSLRCHQSDNMKLVAFPGSALRDGLMDDGSLVLAMRNGRARGDAATYDSVETRNSNWNDRTSMAASKFNQGRHTTFRDYFDRPILLDDNGNLQLHHRHLSSRNEHVMSPVERDRTLRNLEVGELPNKPTSDILQQFRGLRVAKDDKPGLYEVRVPKTFYLVKKYTSHVVHDHHHHYALQKQTKEASVHHHKNNVSIAIKVLNDAVQSGRKIYGITVNNLEDLFRAMDVEGTGVIDFLTFETVVARYHLGITNDQLQSLAVEFDKDGDGTIDYEEMLVTFQEGLEWSNRNIDDLAEHHSDMSRYYENQKSKNKHWKKERRKSMASAESNQNNEQPNEVKEKKNTDTVIPIDYDDGEGNGGVVPVLDSTHVGYYNSTEKACRAYDAVLCGKFGHLKALSYMNMPESSPELWPKWQRDMYHNVTPPYLRINMTVTVPGSPAERPETPFVQWASKSHKIRAEWKKKHDEQLLKDGAPLHLKSHFIGTPTRPSTTSPQKTRNGGTPKGKQIISRFADSLGDSSLSMPSTASSSSSSSSSSSVRRRYKNNNGVWVHYKKKPKKRQAVVKEKEECELGAGQTAEEQMTRNEIIVDRLLNNLLYHITSGNRKVYGHEMKTVEDAFMAFDTEGKGSLGLNEVQQAFKRLGVMATRPQIRKLIQYIDLDNNGRIEFNEFSNVLTQQKIKKDREKDTRRRKGNKKGDRPKQFVTKFNNDLDGDGMVSSSEAAAASASKRNQRKSLVAKQKYADRKKKKEQAGKKLLNEMAKVNPDFVQKATLAFQHGDLNQDGQISFPEFFYKMTGLMPSLEYKHDVVKYKKLFRFWDADNSGAIDLPEFLAVLLLASNETNNNATIFNSY